MRRLPATLQKLAVRSGAGDHLARVLAPWLRVNSVLTTLDLSSNNIGGYWDDDREEIVFTPEGSAAIADALRVNGTVLTNLDLRYNDLNEDVKQALTGANAKRATPLQLRL